MPLDEQAEKSLQKRTLTTLYNVPPSWLRELHEELDRAVLEPYGLGDAHCDTARAAPVLHATDPRERRG